MQNVEALKQGDQIINHVAWCVNPLILASHLLNVSAMLMSVNLQVSLTRDLNAAKQVASDAERYRAAVEAYQKASARVNEMLRDPAELHNLDVKYGQANFENVLPYAEDYKSAALDLIMAVLRITPAQNPTHIWATQTFEKLKALPSIYGLPMTAQAISAADARKKARSRLTVIQGGREA
ncbi:MAG: hypothetical protein ABTQ34_08250 [Bdellovibrionales bacterium]